MSEFKTGIERFKAPPASSLMRPTNGAAKEAEQEAARTGEVARVIGRDATIQGEAGREAGRSIAQGGAALGRGLDTLGAAATRHEAQQEVTAGFHGIVDLTTTLDQSYKQYMANADPYDGEASREWMKETLNPSIQAFTDSFHTPQGKEWAASHAATLATEFYRHTVATDASRATNQVQSSLDNASKKLTSLVAGDPTKADLALSMIPGTIQALTSTANVPPALASKVNIELTDKLSSEIAQTQIKSMLLINPDADVSGLVAKYGAKGWLSGKEAEGVTTAQATLQRMQREQEKSNIQADRSNAAYAAKGVLGSLTNELIQGTDANGRTTFPADFRPKLSQYIMMPGADQNEGRSMLNFWTQTNERNAKGVIVQTNQATYDDFQTRFSLPPTDPRRLTQAEIWQAAADGKLSVAATHLFSNGLNAMEKNPALQQDWASFNQFSEMASGMIKAQAFGNPNDPAVMQRMYEVKRDFAAKFQAGLAQGKTAQDLLSDTSPAFIGGKGWSAMRPYFLTPDQASRDTSTSPLLPPPAVNPNAGKIQSFEDWSKSQKGGQ